jgi:hypothetical protein
MCGYNPGFVEMEFSTSGESKKCRPDRPARTAMLIGSRAAAGEFSIGHLAQVPLVSTVIQLPVLNIGSRIF